MYSRIKTVSKIFVTLSMLAMSGCVVSTDEHNKTLGELTATKTELATTQSELAKLNESISQLKSSVVAQEATFVAQASILSTVTSEKDACEQKASGLEAKIAELQLTKNGDKHSTKKTLKNNI
jgi:septal ring factor EnvC (AmiA/AmiB activator)